MKRLIVAITGASGAIFGIRALELLRKRDDIETHLVISPSGLRTIVSETDHGIDQVRALAHRVYNPKDIGASISSGSFVTAGMLIAPCSIKTLSGIANSYDEGLVVRAADVCLKERRRLVLMLRETPLHGGHIELMARANAAGAIIMPPVPAFYHRPASLMDIVDQSVGRALDLFGIPLPETKRWHGETKAPEIGKSFS
ncbi:3-octaprenyl-4-hydroxybenzoate carboxy-lyase [Skermanella stibiiresistens SB22]|uniref:Flavin prenyltransferase UbiX n=1 Tax=Skermanella stibiiresistens SB22 TaxID=1385369 RepID=W9HB40_9PROT|nr:UbiX family flavin prenyltransferase [Skermanella stibiiresistens]EWY41083.1 3-octaprenyl-4-hydroxybenzoate carboxy-lyase [Skermanella stibiiresistens SB22]